MCLVFASLLQADASHLEADASHLEAGRLRAIAVAHRYAHVGRGTYTIYIRDIYICIVLLVSDIGI